MSNSHASKQLHAIREQLKEVEQQYRDENRFKIARDTVIKTVYPTHFVEEDEVSFYQSLLFYHVVNNLFRNIGVLFLTESCK